MHPDARQKRVTTSPWRIALGCLLSVMLPAGCATLDHPSPADVARQASVAMVFDIDGTLTPSVLRIHTARPDAARALRLLADKGYRIIYLSARRPGFQRSIPGWLENNDFPVGLVFTPGNLEQARHPTEFKRGILRDLQDKGWEIAAAYGDSSTDFDAYRAVGLDPSSIVALLRQGASACEPGPWRACLDSWTTHMSELEALAPPRPGQATN